MDELDRLRIEKCIEYIDGVISDLEGNDITSLESDSLLARATCFSIEQIGEIIKKLEPKFSANYQHIPWKEIYGTRIIIAHHYENIDLAVVNQIVKEDLPALKLDLLTILEEN